MEKYIPPYDITDEMLAITSEITEILGRIGNVSKLQPVPRLRRVNRLRSVQATLAIESNTLSLKQVTDVIDGKRVLGPEEDIIAVKNAFAAYKLFPVLDPFSVADLKRAQGVMMRGLTADAGEFRLSDVGVFDEKGTVIHVAPSHTMVNGLTERLFDWVKNSQTHMLIRSSVFHYEFEFIHPFSDGNGRTGRLWQSVLLASWKPVFEWIPIESMIKEDQAEYYRAIRVSTENGNSNAFITFMLVAIKKSVESLEKDLKGHLENLSAGVGSLMSVIETYPLSARELMQKLGLKSRASFRIHYLTPALEAGLIAMTDPQNPTSPTQRYYKV